MTKKPHREIVTWYTDELPDADMEVLVQTADGEMCFASYDSEDCCWRAYGTNFLEGVIAWCDPKGVVV